MADKDWVYISIHPNQKVKIDKSDVKRVSEYSWRVSKGTTGRPRVVTSVRGKDGVRNITLGRFLMKPPKGKQVYPRRFNDGLDYRKGNLIICTVQERQRLLPKNRKEATSTYRGVSQSGNNGYWRARIEVDGETINLGHFDTESEAALAYNKASKKHFGAMAYQNQVARSKKDRKE